MGYDLVAYFNVDQEKISNELKQLNLLSDSDNLSEELETNIVKWFINTKINDNIPKYARINYEIKKYNDDTLLHVFDTSHSTSFLQDDSRLSCKLYQKELSKKYKEEFPECLIDMNFYIRTSDDAIEASEALDNFFPNDKSLKSFSEWLKFTSKYCDIYELSH